METYPTLNLKSTKAAEIAKFFENSGNSEGNEILNKLGKDVFDKFKEINCYPYNQYFEYDELDLKGESLKIEFCCGSSGLEFLARLMDMFGPISDEISGEFGHDEEEDEDFDSSLSYVDGKVIMMGKKYQFQPIIDVNDC
ncbi:MAG: hypothetical protein ACJAUJ_001813 [Salibacteraceae bacterium]|jgi:hypothetical protein